jgi:hypothetical protein
LNARLTTLLCKEFVTKSKEVKTSCIMAEISKEGYGLKRPVLPMLLLLLLMMMVMDLSSNSAFHQIPRG